MCSVASAFGGAASENGRLRQGAGGHGRSTHRRNRANVDYAHAVCLNRSRTPRRHVSRLYERVARRKGHQKAIGAVARHLAEATYWILTKQEIYREPNVAAVSSTGDKRG